MNAALLCPGPSLAQTFDDDFGGLRVGVNRAVHAFSCDWWCAGDWTTICRNDPPAGTRRLFTTLAAKQHLTAFEPGRLNLFPEFLAYEDLYNFLPPLSCPWPTFSAIAGLVLCAYLKCESVKVYGADWKEGGADWDGHQDADNRRGRERWTDEVQYWESTVKALGDRGMTVERVLL